MSVFDLTNSDWQFRDCSGREWLPARIPGCVHTDLLAAGRIEDPFFGDNELGLQWIEERDWEYRTEFTVPGVMREDETVELVADGLDTLATVRLNGRLVARTDNMFAGHRWNVTRLLRRGRNELAVRFASAVRHVRTQRSRHAPFEFNDPVGGACAIRKQQCQFGWDWGPRFVTAGIWRGLRLESWSGNRLRDVRVTQRHGAKGVVRLELAWELARRNAAATARWRLALDGATVAEGDGAVIDVPRPRLWWPAGQGSQPLYTLDVEVRDRWGRAIGSWSRRIGLRTIILDRRADRWGRSFCFVVNGRPVFAKGANWIPAHSFVAGLKRADYARDLGAAAAANMNMIRVWGGGVYESEDFYDICDELGLLVFQDFMFACTLYPGDAAFAASVRTEAEQQARRLRHRACLALWAGNNEVWMLNVRRIEASPQLRRAYKRLFHDVLPAVVAKHDGVTPYWPSSPWREGPDTGAEAGERSGDTHFWEVWHARKPVKEYEKRAFRFLSEFGMQSYSSPETNATFCPPGNDNVFGAVMENHQKHREGNRLMLDYVSRRYRFPRTQDDLIYLSQLNQAHCMQTAVEHCRRLMPRCMGTLYWQLNDCWPVASWSSIEFTGRWKALHHAARRFYAPALVSAHVPSDEEAVVGNYRRSTVRRVFLHTCYDAPEPARGVLRWELWHVDGRVVRRGRKSVRLRPRTSVRQLELDLAEPLERHGRDRLHLRVRLEIGRRCVSEDTVFLAPPRFVPLPTAHTVVMVRQVAPRCVELAFRSSAFQHRFVFDLPGMAHRATDNFFELYPGETKRVLVELERPLSAAQVRRGLTFRSLVDSAA